MIVCRPAAAHTGLCPGEPDGIPPKGKINMADEEKAARLLKEIKTLDNKIAWRQKQLDKMAADLAARRVARDELTLDLAEARSARDNRPWATDSDEDEDTDA